MPDNFDFLKEACQITGADWAALAERESGRWQLRAAHQVGKTVREALLEQLSRPGVDAWLCGAVNAGRVRSRPAPQVPGLEQSLLVVYPVANTFTVLLVGAKKMESRFQSIWKMIASLRAHSDEEQGVSLLQSELLLPNLQSEAPYDQTRVLSRVLRMFSTRGKAQGGWLAIRRADMLDVLAQWNSPQSVGAAMPIEENPLWRRVTKSLKPVLVDSSQADWEHVPREATRGASKAWACFPLIIGQRMIGAVALWRQKPFTDEQSLALDNLSAQVAPVLEIIITFAAMADHLRRLAVLNDFALTVSSAQNLDQIARRVFALLARVFRTERIALHLLSVDGSMLREYFNREGKVVQLGTEVKGHRLAPLLKSGKTLRLADSAAVGFVSAQSDSVSVLLMPLRYRGRTIGVLALESTRQEAFSIYDEHLLVVITSHLAGLVEYSRLREEAEGRARNLGLIHEVVQEVVGLTAKREIAQITADLLTQYFSYELASVLLLDAEQNPTIRGFGGRSAPNAERLFAHLPWYGLSRTLPGKNASPVLDGIPGRVLRTGRSALVNDASQDADYYPVPGGVSGSLMCVALRDGDQTLGVVNVERRDKNAFTQNDLLDLESLAGILASVVSSADQYQRLQDSIRQLRAAQDELKSRIEAQRSAESRLVQAAKLAAVGEMAAGVAHELNNPLTTVTGFAELTLEDLPADAASRADLELVLREARRARDVVRRLLDFARQTESTRTRADLNEVLDDVIELTRHLMHTSGVHFTKDLTQELPWVSIDRNQMKQVFLNLFHNALQAMPSGGELKLQTCEAIRDGRAWVIASVRDSGEGILPEHKDRLFEPFFTTKSNQGGTGLGLSVTYGIVTDHGGTIEVESQPGKGSTFTVWLPI
jgi:signal transduction histidine kinase